MFLSRVCSSPFACLRFLKCVLIMHVFACTRVVRTVCARFGLHVCVSSFASLRFFTSMFAYHIDANDNDVDNDMQMSLV